MFIPFCSLDNEEKRGITLSNELYKTQIYKSIFGRKIRNKRNIRNVSIQQLAEDSGVSVNHINNIELGKSHPSAGLFHAICNALHIDATTFFKEVMEEVELLILEEE